MQTNLHGVDGELVVVTSDLQAARANFATPDAAALMAEQARGTVATARGVMGGAFIIVGIHWHVAAGGAGVGFRLDHIHAVSGTTVLFNYASQGAGMFGQSWKMFRPLTAPSVSAVPAAVNGGRIALVLNGAPAAGSYLQLDLIHHNDVGLKGTWTALGADAAL